MRLTKVRFILIAVILVFTCLNYIPMNEHLLGCPWTDQYYHVGLAEYIKTYGNPSYGAVSQYHYTPLYHILLVSLSSVSGVEVIYIACFLNFFVPVLLAIPIYLIAIKIFKKKVVGILSVVVLLTSVVITQSQLDPRQLSNIFFLLTMVLLLTFYTKEKLSRWDYSLLFIALFLLLVSHAEGFIRHLLVILPVIVLLYFWYERRSNSFVRGRTKKLLFLVGAFLILPILIVLKDSHLISSMFVPYFTLSPLHSWTILKVVHFVGLFVIVLSVVGLFFVIFSRKKNRLGTVFLLFWIFITLVLGFVPTGGWLYREIYFLVFPLSLLAGYGIYGIYATYKAVKTSSLFKKFILSVLIIGIALLATVEIIDKQSKVETNRSFIESVIWAKNNLDDGKVLGYHRVMWGFQIIFAGSELEPALPFGRRISKLENNPVYIEVMREGNPVTAMRRENIRYIITTTYENYHRFMNDNFELIYDVEWKGVENRHIRIFELRSGVW